MQQPRTWREFLALIIKDPQEKQRLAKELGVHHITLTRWTIGEGKPRLQLLQKLLAALPGQREELTSLIVKELPEFSPTITATEQPSDEIPSAFYRRMLRTLADLSPSLHFWTLCDGVLRQILEQIDPHRLGMSAILAQCMPPLYEQNVRSLREVVGRGTPPWSRELENKAIFLGAESLAGAAAMNAHQYYEPDLQKDGRVPVKITSWERSSVTTPVMRHGRVAGSLITSSTQQDYFSDTRRALLQQFADLLIIVFRPEDFFDPSLITLGIMPPEEQQIPVLNTFRERYHMHLRGLPQSISHQEAETQVWSQLEEELLEMNLQTS